MTLYTVRAVLQNKPGLESGLGGDTAGNCGSTGGGWLVPVFSQILHMFENVPCTIFNKETDKA